MTIVVTPPPSGTNGVAGDTEAPATPAAGTETPAERPQPREVSEFAKRRHALSARAKEVRAREQAAEQRVKDAESRIAAAEKRAEEAAAKTAAWEKSPMAAAKAAGRDLNDVIREGIAESTPEKIAEEARAEVRKLREEQAAKEKAQQEAWQKQQQQAELQQRNDARTSFARAVVTAKTAEGKARYAYIHAEWDDSDLAKYTAQFDDWARSEGKSCSFDQAAEYLDSLAKIMYERRSERRQRLFGESAPGSTDRDTQSPGRDPRGNGSEPRTKAKAASRPLTKAEQEEEDLAMLRRGIEADRAASLKASK